MSTRGVLFDLDGLLVDSEPCWKRAEQVVLERHDRRFSRAIAVTHMGMRLAEGVAVMLRAYDLAHLDAERFGEELIDAFLAELERDFAKLPGADHAIALAASLGPIAIASSSPHRVIDRALRLGGWDAAFAWHGLGDEVARGKPEPDLFLLGADRLGIPAERCTVLEDSRHGVAAAKAAGMRCIAVPSPDFGATELAGSADLVLASLADLRDVHLR